MRGYRVGLSMKETFLSMFVLHNETVNVWTHLIGSLYFLYALIVFGPVPASYISSNSNGIINNSDYENVLATWPITIYIISATMCMALSTIFHLLLNYNYQMNKFVSSFHNGDNPRGGICFSSIYGIMTPFNAIGNCIVSIEKRILGAEECILRRRAPFFLEVRGARTFL